MGLFEKRMRVKCKRKMGGTTTPPLESHVTCAKNDKKMTSKRLDFDVAKGYNEFINKKGGTDVKEEVKRLSLRLDSDTHEYLLGVANENGLSMSAYIRLLINQRRKQDMRDMRDESNLEASEQR